MDMLLALAGTAAALGALVLLLAARRARAARHGARALLVRLEEPTARLEPLEPQLPLPSAQVAAALAPRVSEVIVPVGPWVAHFDTPLRIEKVGEAGGRPLWRLTAPLTYHSLVLAGVGFHPTFTVPAGFETDLTSSPRLPLVFFIAGDTAHAPAALHDYLYRGKLFARRVCDAVMNEAMALHQPSLGIIAVPTWRRVLMVGSLRAMGWWAWNRIVVAAAT